MSVAVGLLVAAAGVATGRWLARRLRARGRDESGATQEAGPGALEPPAEDPFAKLPCKLGDVVTRTMEHDEAWLAGALVFWEERPLGALFVAPEAGGDRAVLAYAESDRLAWLTPLRPEALTLPEDPPHSIEHNRVLFERTRRFPVRLTRTGVGAPEVGDRAVVAEYSGPARERVVVVAGNTCKLCWSGVALEKGEYDVLPGPRERG